MCLEASLEVSNFKVAREVVGRGSSDAESHLEGNLAREREGRAGRGVKYLPARLSCIGCRQKTRHFARDRG